MKYLLMFFSVFFLVFFFLGLKDGTDEAAEKDYLTSHIFEKVTIKQIGQRWCLVYRTEKNRNYAFDIDHNALVTIDVDAERNRYKVRSARKDVQKYFNTTLYSMLGAGTLGFTAKDIFKASLVEELNINETLLKVVGLLTGGYAGYYMGHRVGIEYEIPSETSSEFVNVITSDSVWVSRKKFVFYNLNNFLFEKTHELKRHWLLEYYNKKLDSSLLTVSQNAAASKNLTSENFKDLFLTGNKIMKLVSPIKDSNAMSYGIIIVIVIAVIVGLVLLVLDIVDHITDIKDNRSRRKIAKKSR